MNKNPVTCDYCGLPIQCLDDGMVEWRYVGKAGEMFHSIRLVHGAGGRRGCTFHEQGKTGQLLDHHAYVFAWPGRHARYLRELGRNHACIEVVEDILQRCKELRVSEPPARLREHQGRFRMVEQWV